MDTSGVGVPVTTVRNAAVVLPPLQPPLSPLPPLSYEGRHPRIASLALAVELSLPCRGGGAMASVHERRRPRPDRGAARRGPPGHTARTRQRRKKGAAWAMVCSRDVDDASEHAQCNSNGGVHA